MKETIKDLAKSTVISIGMAMAIFCLAGIVFDVRYKGNLALDLEFRPLCTGRKIFQCRLEY